MILATVCMRLFLLILAAWCLKRVGSSIWAMWRGSQSLAEAGRASQAAFALAVTTGQVFYLLWPEPVVLLLALSLSSIGLGLAIWTSKRAEAKGLLMLDAMIDRPDLALPLVELAELAEEEALALAQEVRRQIAERKMPR